MSQFWTSSHLRGDTAYVRGYANGKLFAEKQEVKPYLFAEDPSGDYSSVMDGRKAKRVDFDSVSEASKWLDANSNISNKQIYGLQHFLYTHLNSEFPGEVEFDTDLIARCTVDIETDSSGGFPNVETADKEITAITLTHRKNGVRKIAMFATKAPYTPKHPEARYRMCRNEADMLERFLELWNDPEWTPDVLTGWYIEGFDIPYIVRRIGRVLGESMPKMLSPWRIIKEREIARGKSASGDNSMQTVYEIFGVSILDYLELYKKFSFKNHESYKLDHIAMVELGKKKLDYSEYGSLDGLFRNNFELYMDYNLVDTLLVDELDEKLGLIDLVLTFAYDAKIAFNDTMTTTRPWDVIIHNYLIERKLVIPRSLGLDEEDRQIVGGYVKDPITGIHEGVVNYDFDSLYPHLIMGWNISPETCVGRVDFNAINSFKRGTFERDVEALRPILKEKDAILAGNGYLFSKSKRGFLPALMEKFYADRVVYKTKMIEAKKAFQETKDPKYKSLIARYQNLQQARKIALNACYGSLANKYYRWFALFLAEAITTSGQMSSMWVEQKLNEKMNAILGTDSMDYVIAVDTDSCYLSVSELLDKFKMKDQRKEKVIDFLDAASKGKFEKIIKKNCVELTEMVNCNECKLNMKRENIADKGVWTAKKRYILNVWDSEGVRFSEPEVKVTGMDSVRSSTPMVCREAIKNCFHIMMNKDERALQDYMAEFRKEFMLKSFLEVASPRGISGLAKYHDSANIYGKGTPIQVRGALLYNHYLREMGLEDKYPLISEGSKAKYAYLKLPNPFRENVIAVPEGLPEEFGLENCIDRGLQFDKSFSEPIKKITDVMGWQVKKASSLKDFM